MSLSQRDLILRWIATISKLVARLVGRRDEALIQLALDQIAEAEREFLGLSSELVARLDPESAADLLGDPFRIYSYAQLLALRGAVEEAQGAAGRGRAVKERALLLARQAMDRAEEPPDEWGEWVEAAARDLAETPPKRTGEP